MVKGNIYSNTIFPTKEIHFSLVTEQPPPMDYKSPVTGAAQVK